MTDAALTDSPDENLWLEDIHGDEPLRWAAAQTAATLDAFAGDEFESLTDELLEVIDSDERIPLVTKRGEFYYNFWRDRSHPRGLWRRTTFESYRAGVGSAEGAGGIDWQVLLDVDELGRDEGAEWVFSRARLLPHEHTRALVSLSPDGGDATTIREFDLVSRSFVTDGFEIPTSKGSASWIDRDTLYVATDFGPGSMTSSSYPRTVRVLHRGESLADAQLVHEVADSDLMVEAHHDHTPGFERDLVTEVFDFYRSRQLLRVGDELVPIQTPEDADVSIDREWMLVQPRSSWAVGGVTHAVGSLIAIRFDDFLAGDRAFSTLFVPDERTSLQSWAWTRDHLVLTLLVDVASRLVVLTPPLGEAAGGEADAGGADAGGAGAGERVGASSAWARSDIAGLPALSTVRVIDTDPEESNEIWIHATGFTTPASVLRAVLPASSRGEAGAVAASNAASAGESLVVVATSPSFFDASGLVVEQHWAVSDDGTRVPYFQVGAADLELDGSHPTVLSGYGGFQASRLPDYSGVIGRAWLARGGVFVLANIRGGGEFGPAWHTSALRENRPRAYEDFAAVARDLVTRGVTVPARLACEGRSNGGLLVGNMLTTYPSLFGAIVCGVPLLDMQRYTHLSAGASWIAEYGDPDVPGDWEFIKTFSPYHLLRDGVQYPPTLIYAATSDDRVGPVQGRKMAARMQAMGVPGVLYYENDDGGHGGAVDNRASARLFALMYDFAWRRLMG